MTQIRRGSSYNETLQQHVPVSIQGLEDPLFGPTVSFALAGSLSDLVGDRVFRIPPLSGQEVSEMVRAPKASPLLFGYRGSELVNVEALEDLLGRVALMKDELPQLQRLDLSLVHVSVAGAHVLSAHAWVAPVADARSSEFVRRLPDA
ncbi:MAG: acetate--CoA ligase family protein [Marmoricola sp.]